MMYYIVVKSKDTIMEYITVHRDKNQDLALIDITTIPYFVEEPSQAVPVYFEDIVDITDYLKKIYKVESVQVTKLKELSLSISQNLKMSSMEVY